MKKFIRSKNILSIILCLIIASAMFPTGVMTASAEAAKTYHVSSDTELDAAVAEINSMDSGTYDIYIDSDFTKNGGYALQKNTVTIYGEGHTITFTGVSQGFNVMNGTTLNLGAQNYSKTLTLSGDNTAEVDAGLIYINNVVYPKIDKTYDTSNQSVCNMYSGVTLKDHRSDNNYGGGVTVEGAIFHIQGP